MKMNLPETGIKAATLARTAFDAARHPDVTIETEKGFSLSGIPRKEKDYARGIVYLREMAARRATKNQAFLGGACGTTTWRKDVAVPALEKAGLKFWNPQVDDWAAEDKRLRMDGVAGGMAEAEARAKAESAVLLFVLGPETRGIATLVEIAEVLGTPFQQVVLCVQPMPKGAVVDGEALSDAEIDDINAARYWVRDKATELIGGWNVHPTVDGAVARVVSALKENEGPSTLK